MNLFLTMGAPFFGLLSICACTNGSQALASQTPPEGGWSDRGVFVLGQINFDFVVGRWSEGPFGGTLEDCSDEETYCMRSEAFNVVLPRACKDIRGAGPDTTWTRNELTTKVYYRRDGGPPPLHQDGASGTVFYLGDPGTPNVVFEYDTAVGITRLLYDRESETDFAQLASDGSIATWLMGYAYDRDKSHQVFNIVTFDQFGACKG